MDPLAQLKDIHLPAEVGLWPLSYGWWLLTVVLIVGLLAAVVGIIRYYRRRKARRQALQSLNNINPQQPDWPNRVNQVLKRAALSYFPAADVASLHSQQWLGFLAGQLPERNQGTFRQQLEPMLAAQYSQQPSPDFDTAHGAARQWISKALPPKRNRQGGQHV